LEFVPLEEDLLSLEMDDVARDLYLVSDPLKMGTQTLTTQHGDDTTIYYSSLALMTFQRAFGLFPRILGKGDGAKVCVDRRLSKANRAEIGRPAATPPTVWPDAIR
jgi:hypothetical protein